MIFAEIGVFLGGGALHGGCTVGAEELNVENGVRKKFLPNFYKGSIIEAVSKITG